MLFLNAEEIRELTGFKLATAQCRWLASNSYPHDKNHSGKPMVLRSYLEQRLCPSVRIPHGFEEPNFNAFR